MNVTCTAVGGTDPVSYQWSSTCRDCPFQTENSKSVIRTAVRTGDIGNHTCTATSGLISGSKTISFDVVGKQNTSFNLNIVLWAVLQFIALQVLEYMYSEVLQLVTFKSQDRFQTMGLSFPVLQPMVDTISVSSVALAQ